MTTRKYERLAKHNERKVEAIFVMLQMMTSPMVAFARGANDVSNGIYTPNNTPTQPPACTHTHNTHSHGIHYTHMHMHMHNHESRPQLQIETY